MTENEPSGAQKMFGEFAPKLAQLTDDVLFGDVWERHELSPRDRSLVTITALVAGGNSEQLGYHISLGRKNGVTEAEIKEAIIHLAFYTGWPKAITAIMVARDPFAG
jgi:4-carboxymuconolactone decarboxylase